MMSIHIPLLHGLHTSTANFAIKNLSCNSKMKRMFAKGIGVFFPANKFSVLIRGQGEVK